VTEPGIDSPDPHPAPGASAKVYAALLVAVQFGLASFLSFSIALQVSWYLHGSSVVATIGAMWALISAMVVTQDTRTATFSTAWLRVFGSVIGATISAIYLSFFPFSSYGMAFLVALTIFICVFMGIPGHARLAGLTVAIVMIVSALNPDIPPLVNAATRFFEVIVGSTVAVSIAWLWQYLPAPQTPSE
jgi:uncharacterized membrane protein YccC